MTITTSSKYNFDEAENDIFSWNTWDGTSGETLWHKESGRRIYHMSWINKDTGYADAPVTGEIKEQAVEFWHELRDLQSQKPPVVEDPYFGLFEEEHGHGWCDKCQSYCYGDCEANS